MQSAGLGQDILRQAAQAERLSRLAIIVCFFFSGAAALSYEVVWARLLTRIFGATLFSSTTVITVFMAGLAAGAYLSGRFYPCRGNLWKTYAWIEAATGTSSLVLSFLFSQSIISLFWPLLAQFTGSSSVLLLAGRFLLAAIVLAVPTCLMGATLPVACSYLANNTAPVHRQASYLYAASTTGALFGAFVTGFLLLPSLGLSNTLKTAVAVNFLLAATALALSRQLPTVKVSKYQEHKIPELTDETVATDSRSGAHAAVPVSGSISEKAASAEHPRGKPGRSDRLGKAVTLLLTVSGAASMILEVVWIRLFSLIFSSSSYSLSAVLTLVLAGLAGGAWLGSRMSGKRGNPLLLGYLQLLAGATIYLSLFFISVLPYALLSCEQALAGLTGQASFACLMTARFAVAALVILPTSCSLGALFPLAITVVVRQPAEAAFKVGRLYAFNTAGAIVGTWLAGFIIIPLSAQITVSGIQTTLAMTASLELAAGAFVIMWWQWRKRSTSRTFALAILAAAAGSVVILRPDWDPELMSSGVSFTSSAQLLKSGQNLFKGSSSTTESGNNLLYYREGLNTTVTVGSSRHANIIYLKTDGKVDVSVPLDPCLPSPGSDLATQVLLGVLPTFLHRGPISDALLLGYGSGTTAGCLLHSQCLGKLTVCELESSVLATNKLFIHVNKMPTSLANAGKLNIVEQDGRNYLSLLPHKLDLIVSQPGDPWVGGSSDLFTREFWQLAATKLKDNGLFCQWIQLYAITPRYLAILCRTFTTVFPETYMFQPSGGGEVILIGCKGSIEKDISSLTAKFAQPSLRRDLLRISIHSPCELLSLLKKEPGELSNFTAKMARMTGDNRLNTDDNLLIECELPKQLAFSDDLLQRNLSALGCLEPSQAAPAHSDLLALKAAGKQPWKSDQAAFNCLEQAVAHDPLDVDSLYSLGRELMHRGNNSLSEKYLRASLDLDPNQFAPRLCLAKLLCRTKRLPAGLEQLKIASSLKPDASEPLLFATVMFYQLHAWSLALENLQELEQRSKGNPVCDLLAQAILSHLGLHQQAHWHLLRYQATTGSKTDPATLKQALRKVFLEADLPSCESSKTAAVLF